jgi:putative DNA primase/helicase
VAEIATHAPKLLYTSPVKDAGKSTALHVVRRMVQRAYPAVEATGAVLYRIIDRLKPTLLLDEADTLFKRRTALAHIINESWTNSGSKIPRAKPVEKGTTNTTFTARS